MAVSNEELACVYAALICYDEKVEVTADKINTILKASNVKVEPFYPGLFAKFLSSNSLEGLLTNIGGGGAAPAAAPAAEAGAAADAAPAAAAAKEPSEEDEDMGFGLFD